MPSSAATASEAGAWSDRGQGTLSEAYDSLSARSATDRSGSDHRSSSVNEATADGMAREEARREGEIEVSDIPGALASELQLFAVIGKGGYGTVYKGASQPHTFILRLDAHTISFSKYSGVLCPGFLLVGRRLECSKYVL